VTRIVINRPTRLFAACLLGLPALLGLPGVAPARAQAGAAAPPQRTHVERFSTPEMLAERAEAEAEPAAEAIAQTP